LILIGYAITAYLFASRLNTAKSIPELELSWGYDTINVAMLALGFFMLIKNLTYRNPDSWFAKLIEDVSLKTYGIYLLHIIVLNTAYGLMISWITGQEYLFPLISVVTFFSSYLVIKMISYLPGSKYIIG
jgi:surface polysaccharide O-acyltransferase-like enzyme